jgi:hypothetical protein
MKSLVVMLVGACLVVSARAQTFAEVALTHLRQSLTTSSGIVILRDQDLHFELRTDGDSETAGGVSFAVAVNAGETMTTVFDYTITLSTLGLPYPGPRTEYCTPISFVSQCMEPFGVEATFAQVLVGFRDPRNVNPFIDMTIDQVTLTEADMGGGHLTQSGQLTSEVSTNAESGVDFMSAAVFVNAFAAPVPEASTWTSVLAGMFLLPIAAALGRRRVPSMSPGSQQ